MAPLISILTPCYGATDTLPMALASLRAQSLSDWECIIVDDGSRRPIAPVVESFDDPRFRLVTHGTNRGRGSARQAALDASTGQFVAMLDADDWYYHHKLERQVELLDAHPRLAAITSSMIVFDHRDRVVGRRDFSSSPLTIRRATLEAPPQIGFAPSLLRGHLARQHRFDHRLRRAEDPDYLRRVLAGRLYGATDEIHYAYCEAWSPEAIDEAFVAFDCQRRTARRDWAVAPLAMSKSWLKATARSATYAAFDAAGISPWLFWRRNQPTTEAEREHYDRQRTHVEHHLPH